ncbi:MAG: 23S rRNA (adenine(2503)-C(2))-methyltransferase RlmN [Deltaproteobacteria bacterium]|nr:23S rRNA (adenine(2503)-C(2))-methyltransferase RlmN [Deltaproteobacteria bacterium]
MKNLRGMTYEDILQEVTALGAKPYRAEQIFTWIYKRGITGIDAMTDVSKVFRELLKEGFFIGAVDVAAVRRSPDGTVKLATRLEDGLLIESVLIPDADRLTLCVSSQAGCALGCKFCATGMNGFIRNLTLGELTGQVFAAQGLLEEGARITNAVMMGMGEPLLNYDNVIHFTGILTDARGFGLSHNKVTISTAGIIPGIERMAREAGVNLAVSINAATDEVRGRIMPVNNKYPLAGLVGALRAYPLTGRKVITIEYVLLKNVNDSTRDAEGLIKLLKGITCKINIIPLNPFPGARFSRPDDKAVEQFANILRNAGLTALVRFSKGADVQGACGQLAGECPSASHSAC